MVYFPEIAQKIIIEKVLYYDFDDLIDFTLTSLVKTEPENAAQELIQIDKFYIYRELWKETIVGMYKKYIPEYNYSFNWLLEATPYTFTLAKLIPSDTDYIDLAVQKGVMDKGKVKEEFPVIFDRIGMTELLAELPDNILPANEEENINLVCRIMNFPPLRELAIFYKRYYDKIDKEFKDVSGIFNKNESLSLPAFGVIEPFHCSVFPVSHESFKKIDLDELIKDRKAAKYASAIESIKNKTALARDKYKVPIICSCCGKQQNATLPDKVLNYKFFLEYHHLANYTGLLYIDEFENGYKKNISDTYLSFFDTLNKVEQPALIILVEGDSEEISIPLLAFRERFLLKKSNVFVHNCGSKEKLYAYFLDTKAKFPDKKMICVLDNDAVKEKEGIERIIKDNLNKYGLIYIENGTWEDMFPLEISVGILNELYIEGEEIILSDFDRTKDFNTNVKKILYQKKIATFDKVKFAQLIAMKISMEEYPKEITELFLLTKKLTEIKPGVVERVAE